MPRFAKYEENDEPISGYRLVDFLGAGQFGEVWKAVDTESGIFVAIKLIDLSHSTSALKELKALNLVRNLRHPNLVPIFTARLKDKNGKEHALHKADEVKGKGQLRELVIAMGLGDRSLSSRLKQLNPDGTDPDDFKGIPYEELISYMEGAAKGIDYLNKVDHGLGKGVGDGPIIHCDIKPDNMMVVAGEVQIADCGVAVIITPDARQTKAAGSPAYSAPELTGNKPVPGTDQYALAISYYELRTGKLPFDESMGQLSIMLAHAEGRLDFSSPLLSEYEIRVLKWATAVQPKLRYPSCIDMVKQLTRAQYDLPPLAPDQLGVKSGVVSVPLNRTKPAAEKPTPPKPAAKTKSDAGKGTQKFEPESPPADELRGTVIPDSDRMLPPSQAGFTLPPVEAPPPDKRSTDKRSTGTRPAPAPEPPAAKYQASQSEIMLPLGDEGLLDDDFDPDADDAPTQLPPSPPAAQAPTTRPPSAPAYEQSIVVDRPQINMNPDDPLGGVHGTIELDPEIKAILRKSAPVGTPPPREAPAPQPQPAARTTSVPTAPRPASNPVIIPPVAPGKRSTQYPRETPAAEVEADPPSETEPKSLPSWAKEAERERLRSTGSGTADVPAALQTDWRKETGTPAKTGGGLPVKLLVGGVLVGGIAAGGFFALKGGGDKGNPNNTDIVNNDGKNKSDDSGKVSVPPVTVPVALPASDDPIAKSLAEIRNTIDKRDPDSLRKAAADLQAVDDKIAALPDGKKGQFEVDRNDTKRLLEQAQRADTINWLGATLRKAELTDAEVVKAEKLIAEYPEAYRADVEKYKAPVAAARTKMAVKGLIAELKAAKALPPNQFAATAKTLLGRAKETDSKKALAREVIDVGVPPEKIDYREGILDVLSTTTVPFADLVTEPADRQKLVEWQVELLTPPLKAAKDALQKLAAAVEPSDVDLRAAQAAVSGLRAVVTTGDKRFAAAWKVPDDIAAFLTAAEKWSGARGKPAAPQPFADLFKPGALLPAPAAPFLMEYLRLASAASPLPITTLRGLRDDAVAKRWPGVSDDELERIKTLFQNALALQVRDDVSAADPKWPAIRVMIDKDAANGWAKLVAAEQALLAKEKPDAVLELLRAGEAVAATDATAEDRKTYVAYLRGLATKDEKSAEALATLFRPAVDQLPPLLRPEFRRKAAAEVLAASAPAPKKLDDLTRLLTNRTNPYDRDPKALDRLQVAHRLAGKDHPEWSMPLALLADASGDSATAVKAAAEAKVDDTKVPTADVPVALAFCLQKAANKALRDDSRTQAAAAAARLALRAVDTCSDPALTMKSFAAAEAGYFKLIRDQILTPAADLSGSPGDKASLRLSQIRATQLRSADDLPKADAIDDVVKALERAGDPDLANALGYRAGFAFFTFGGGGNAAWERIHADVDQALRLDPDNRLANYALAYATAAEFGLSTVVKPPPDKARPPSDFAARTPDALNALAAFDKAGAALQNRKDAAFWLVRAKFLRAAANDFAFADRPANAPPVDVKALLEGARKAVQTAAAQRDPGPKSADNPSGQRHEEPWLEGQIIEDLARLTQAKADAKKTFQAALDKMKLAAAPTTPAEYESLVDAARCTVRAVEAGAFDPARLADAEQFLDDLAEAEKSAAATLKPYVQRFLRDGQLWRGVLLHTRKDYKLAEQAFDKAAADLQAYEGEVHLLATALAYRGENALDAAAGGKLTDEEAAKVVGDCADKLRDLLKEPKKVLANGTVAFVDTGALAFVPDYLEGRLAARKNSADAGRKFQAAYRAIGQAKAALRVDHGFAVRCLAHAAAHLGADAGAARQLLTRLGARFPWGQDEASRKLIADASK